MVVRVPLPHQPFNSIVRLLLPSRYRDTGTMDCFTCLKRGDATLLRFGFSDARVTPLPNCKAPGSHLSASSQYALVDYFRCQVCGHVWTEDKNRRDKHARDVTDRKKPA